MRWMCTVFVCGFATSAHAVPQGSCVPLEDACTTISETDELSAILMPDDEFGQAVDVLTYTVHDWVIVGAAQGPSETGFASIYHRFNQGAWDPVAVLTASDGTPNDRFGASVSISGASVDPVYLYAIIGASEADLPGKSDAGAAYVFRRELGVWEPDGKLVADDPAALAQFGTSVAIDARFDPVRAIVGAPRDSENGVRSGAAYIFERDDATGDWDQIAKLDSSNDARHFDEFGFATSTASRRTIRSRRAARRSPPRICSVR